MVEIGTTISATVTRIEPYGVWLEHHGEKVLVLAPELSWESAKRIPDMVQVGQELIVKAIRYNYPKHTIVGSVRALQPEKNPYRQLSLLDPDTSLTAKVIFLAGDTVTVELQNKAWGHLPIDGLEPQLRLGDVVEVVIYTLEVEEGRLVVHLAPQENLQKSKDLVSAS